MFCITALFMTGCVQKEDEPSQQLDDFKLIVTLPKNIEVSVGDVVSGKYTSGLGPQEGDVIILRHKTNRKDYECELVFVEEASFGFKIPKGLPSGEYTFFVKRGDIMKAAAKMQITVNNIIVVPEKEGYNLYGSVSCDGVGLEGVLISDGVDFVETDADGFYYMKSKEETHVMFIVQPSGYEVEIKDAIPQNWKYIDGNVQTKERMNFKLTKVNNDNHVMYMIGDLHLAKRINDINQYTGTFIDDFKKKISSNSDKRQYAITLGDLAWDRYWYENSFDLFQYRELLKQQGIDIPIYNTIGNHDHDMKAAGDFMTAEPWKKIVGPTYCSFNIGQVHYVILDNIICTNTAGGEASDRHYELGVSAEQLEWLNKDLSYVKDKNTRIVITMHAQICTESGWPTMSTTMASIKESLKGFKNVDIYTGHTHRVYNNETSEYYHHNAGAVCATWWWTGYYHQNNGVCKDGTPSGYYQVDMNGTDTKWLYKACGKVDDYQFRTYDRNDICLTPERYVPAHATDHFGKDFNSRAKNWNTTSKDNYVYLNVWAWDPQWNIEVTENGKPLKVETATLTLDPLHLISYEAMRYNAGAEPTGDFKAHSVYNHIFKVKASSPTSTLEIKVTDRFGRVFTQSMKRPKKFSIDTYVDEYTYRHN